MFLLVRHFNSSFRCGRENRTVLISLVVVDRSWIFARPCVVNGRGEDILATAHIIIYIVVFNISWYPAYQKPRQRKIMPLQFPEKWGGHHFSCAELLFKFGIYIVVLDISWYPAYQKLAPREIMPLQFPAEKWGAPFFFVQNCFSNSVFIV